MTRAAGAAVLAAPRIVFVVALVGAVATGASLAACAGARAPKTSTPAASPPSAAPGPWRAEVRVLDDGSRLAVTLCFEGARPAALFAEDPVLVRAARHLRWTKGRDEGALAVDGRVVALTAAAPDACVAYDIDLDDTAALLRGSSTAVRVGTDILATPDVWLLHPEPVGAGRVVFETTPPISVATPWPTDGDGAFVVDASTFRFRTMTAFGPLRTSSIDVGGARLDVVVLDGGTMRAGSAGVARWLSAAARAVSSTGGFPVDHVTLFVMPVDRMGGASVAYGEVMRGGGPHVYLMASADADEEALVGEWVAVHELSHLLLPPIAPADAWLYEGIASYYQNVLRGRAGLLDERAAWQQLHDGFERGRGAIAFGTLQDASASLNQTFAFQRVYWGGAAFALSLDTALRRESAGRVTLDDALRGVRQRLPANARTTAAVLLATIEEETGSQAPRRLFRDLVQGERFPALDDEYAALGLRVVDGRVELDDAAKDAAIRRAIAAPQPAVAPSTPAAPPFGP